MRLSTAAQMRASDRITIEDLGLPGVTLMETAGRAAAAHLRERALAANRHAPPARLFCGGGNNGGDGFVIARMLAAWGWDVEVILTAPRDKAHGDAAEHLRLLERVAQHRLSPGPCRLLYWGDYLQQGATLEALLAALPSRPVLVDALLGTGISGPPRGHTAALIAHINRCDAALTFAVDIPSGLCSDTGRALGEAVRADATSTFGLARLGHLLEPGRSLSGDLRVHDIGIPDGVFTRVGVQAEALTQALASALLPPRPPDGHKGTFGHVLVVGGAPGTTGALALASIGALRGGAGLVTAAGAPEAVQLLPGLYPEVMTLPLRGPDALLRALPGKTLAIGPGLGTSPDALKLLDAALDAADSPLVLDADALNLVAAHPQTRARLLRAAQRLPVVLTPHPGEFARLANTSTPELLQDAPAWTRRLANELHCVTLCKTSTTLVAHPDGRLAINTTGHPGMATGGSGDVLTGLIAAILAQRPDAWDAARLSVFLHGLAGTLAGGRALIAGDIAAHLGEATALCETKKK